MEREVLKKAQSYIQDFIDFLNGESKNSLYGIIANINSLMLDNYGLKSEFSLLLPNELSGKFAIMMWNLRDPNPYSKDKIADYDVAYVKKCLEIVNEAFNKELEKVKEKDGANFINSLIEICSSLQVNITYRDTKDQNGNIKKVSEDQRTYYVRDALNFKKFDVRSQEHQGISENGISSGEVDLLIYDEKEQPKIYIECMNIDCLNKKYIKRHYEKLFLYDSSINKNNYLISYVTVNDFKEFYNKYKNYFSEYDGETQCSTPIEYKTNYANIKVYVTESTHNDNIIKTYHILVYFAKID